MELVFATNNFNKLQEVKLLLPENIKILSLKDINFKGDIAETGKTLQENAHIKADFITDNFNYNCFADDTGLEVFSLNNEPGVYSARYAGNDNNPDKNIEKLLKKLEGKNNRKAQFRTVIALNLNGKKYEFEGVCKGEITTHYKGDKGFGYDPVFIPDGYNKTFAQMTIKEKGAISHRGKAIGKLVDFIKRYKQ